MPATFWWFNAGLLIGFGLGVTGLLLWLDWMFCAGRLDARLRRAGWSKNEDNDMPGQEE